MSHTCGTRQGEVNGDPKPHYRRGAIATVEHLTDLRMDHVAIIDWAGFKDLSTAVGGVPVHIPDSFHDAKQKVQWEAGVLDAGDLTKPLEFNDMLEALTRNLTVDEDWENGEIRSLALSLRGISADRVTFLTVPVSGTPTVAEHGSIVQLDMASTRQLFTAMRDDTVKAYVKAHSVLVLPDEDDID